MSYPKICDCPYYKSCHDVRQKSMKKFLAGKPVSLCDAFKLLKPMYDLDKRDSVIKKTSFEMFGAHSNGMSFHYKDIFNISLAEKSGKRQFILVTLLQASTILDLSDIKYVEVLDTNSMITVFSYYAEVGELPCLIIT